MIYHFNCPNHGVIEIQQSLKEPLPTKCPECGAKLTRKYTVPNVVYRGSGFFSTDKALYENGDDE